MSMSIYDFVVKDIKCNDVSLSKYKGKVMLIVNVASKCGNTKQYEELQQLYDKYKDKGLAILGFPCNQFFMQEPKSNDEILEFCQTKYNVTFDMFAKIKVNGKEGVEPLYDYLKNEIKWTERAKNVKWNFEKFLVDRDGKVVDRIMPKTTPFEIEDKIKNLIDKN